MTKEELIVKLNDLEWEDFEVKEAKSSVPKSCWETVSAFSNTAGGWLVFGVKEKGKTYEIQGVDNSEKIEQDFLNTLRGDKFNTFIDTKQERYTIDNKVILAFYIPVSSNKPVYYNTQANTYIRRSSSDQKARKNEIDAFYRDQTFGTKTSEILSKTTVDSLSIESIKSYRSYMARFNPDASYNRLSDDQLLTKLRIVQEGCCTYGGLLFLGKREVVEQYFPDFRIDLMEIPGVSYKEASTRYTFRLGEYDNLWDYYFECFERLKKQTSVDFAVSNEGFASETSPGLEAIREALVNLLMHTDFFAPSHPRIRLFSDRLEFYNPGGLPKPLDEIKRKDLSIPRNPIISKLFRMVRLAENAGFGFDKIDHNWKAYSSYDPEYDIDFDSTTITLKLPRADNKEIEVAYTLLDVQFEFRTADHIELQHAIFRAHSKLIGNELRDTFGITSDEVRTKFGQNSDEIRTKQLERFMDIMKLILLDSFITAKAIGSLLNVSSRTIEKDIQLLRDTFIKREGSDKTGEWLLINNDL